MPRFRNFTVAFAIALTCAPNPSAHGAIAPSVQHAVKAPPLVLVRVAQQAKKNRKAGSPCKKRCKKKKDSCVQMATGMSAAVGIYRPQCFSRAKACVKACG